MVEVLKFVLGNFWHFVGTALLLYIVFEGLESIVRAFRCQKEDEVNHASDPSNTRADSAAPAIAAGGARRSAEAR